MGVSGALRVLTYNVHGLRSGVGPTSSVIVACRPDVVCVQEAPRVVRRIARRVALAERSGLRVVTGWSLAGLLILAVRQARIVHTEAGWLSLPSPYPPRGFAAAVLDISGVRVVVGDTHLDLDLRSRERHADDVLRRMDRLVTDFECPAVLAGDVNETPDGPVWRRLAGRLQDSGTAGVARGCVPAATFPARRPRRRIDAVFADSRFGINRCAVPNVPGVREASDHLPVLAELSLRPS